MKPIWIAVLLAVAASSVSADTAKFDPADKRLDKKVTLQVSHTKLEDVAASLSKQSGVTIKAGTSTRDWRVRQQHATVHAKDVPLGDILDELAKLHSYHLSREGKEGEWTYTIWQDKKSRDLEAEMLNAEQEADAQRAKDTRQAMVDLAKKAAKMTPEEAKKLRDKDPNLAYLGGTNTGRAYSQLFNSFSQTDLDLMLRGKRVTIPFASLPPDLQKAAMVTTTSGIAALDSRESSEFTPFQLVVSPLREDIAGELVSFGVGGAMALMGMPQGGLTGSDFDPILGAGQPMSVFLLSKPDSKFGKAVAQCMIAMEEGTPADQVEQMLGSIIGDEQGMADASAHDSPTEKTPPTDPELTREVELGKLVSEGKRGQGDISANAWAVAAIAEATGFTVMLESFTRPASILRYLQSGKQPLYKILIGLEKAGCTWSLEQKNLRVRPEDWAIRRSYDIPESTIAYWWDRLEKQGYFDTDDLSAIVSALTDDQITRTLHYDDDIGYAIVVRDEDADHDRTMLRLYASLSSSQKAAISTKQGLRFSDLSDRQWDYLAPVIMDRFGGISIADGFITNWQQESADAKPSDFRHFEMMVIGDDRQEHAFALTIRHASREDLADRIAARKKAREAAKEKQPEPQNPPGK